jgi:uncharacterized membrane protein (UPF0136 family)
MNYIELSSTWMYAFGTFLFCCGIMAVVFIGLKAKTALISGGMAGSVSIAIAYLISTQTTGAHLAAIIWALVLFGVFAWRSTKTLHKVFELIPTQHEDLKGKGIAFLIISLMAVVSIITAITQVVLFITNA